MNENQIVIEHRVEYGYNIPTPRNRKDLIVLAIMALHELDKVTKILDDVYAKCEEHERNLKQKDETTINELC